MFGHRTLTGRTFASFAAIVGHAVWPMNCAIAQVPAFQTHVYRVNVSQQPANILNTVAECARIPACKAVVEAIGVSAGAPPGSTSLALAQAGELGPIVTQFMDTNQLGMALQRNPKQSGEFYLTPPIPAGYQICSVSMEFMGAPKPTRTKASIFDMTFSMDKARGYFYVPKDGGIGGGSWWWDGRFYFTFVRDELIDHARQQNRCGVTKQPQKFRCAGTPPGTTFRMSNFNYRACDAGKFEVLRGNY